VPSPAPQDELPPDPAADDRTEDNPPTPTPTSTPLDQIIDDDTPRQEAIHWAADELFADHTFDEVAASLVEGGWSEDAAQEIVEAARQQTRDQRGVLTRDRTVGRADARAFRDTLRRWGHGGDASYLLLVDVTDADVYRAFAARPAAASRTSGRRVGLRLALLRLSDGAAVWIAGGTGEMWETWTDERGNAAVPATVDDDLRVGNAGLYPPPPDARVVSRRLTRRLLALVPTPAELQPN